MFDTVIAQNMKGRVLSLVELRGNITEGTITSTCKPTQALWTLWSEQLGVRFKQRYDGIIFVLGRIILAAV